MTDRRPNLLFITTDHQRADSLGMVQAGVEVTPNLNRLAAQGITFTRAYTTSPLCAPARTALATGKYPTHNGLVFNDWAGTRAGDHKPIHQYLAEAGYAVGYVGVHHIRVKPPLPERVPFAKWVSNPEHAEFLAQAGIAEEPETLDPFKRTVIERQGDEAVPARYSNTKTAVWPYPLDYFKDWYFCREAVDFITAQKNQPFALFLYLWAPHPPLQVPEPYASRFDPARLDLPWNVGQPAIGEPPNRRQGVPAQLAGGVSLAEWRRVWAAHLGLVHLADAGIGRVLDALAKSGQADQTCVVFTVDHGDHLGQHGMYQKMEMYEQAIRVPLIFKGPDILPRQFDTPVSHLDIMPTLLEMTNISLPDDLDGLSLHASLKASVPPPERPLFCQYSGNPTLGDIRRAVITRSYKYIYDPADSPELYDLAADPLEMNNLALHSGFEDVVQQLHEVGKAWAETHGDWVNF